jgi:hypothetical protein
MGDLSPSTSEEQLPWGVSNGPVAARLALWGAVVGAFGRDRHRGPMPSAMRFAWRYVRQETPVSCNASGYFANRVFG